MASSSTERCGSTIGRRTCAAGRCRRPGPDVHFLKKKNAITELTGHGSFTDPHTLQVDLAGGGTETVTFDHAIIATGASARLLPGTALSERVRTFEEQS